jgi:tRNA-modifying protein YgfZ
MSGRDVVRVSGPEAPGWLQGQLSQDVEGLAEGDETWSFLLAPTGRVDSWFRVRREGPTSFLLDVDAGWGPALVARLERFKLRTAATVEALEEPAPPVTWPGLDDPDDERSRILAGLPRLGRELTADTIPAEVGRRVIEASVSFTKGCYTGQELVARIDSRGGNVPRPVRRLEADDPLAEGAEVRVGGEAVGAVTSAAGAVALAVVARRIEPGATVDVAGVTARVHALDDDG